MICVLSVAKLEMPRGRPPRGRESEMSRDQTYPGGRVVRGLFHTEPHLG